MARTFTYAVLDARPRPQSFGDDSTSVSCNTEYLLSITGPASSLSDGMAIASISTDITYIAALWEVKQASDTYAPLQFETGTGALASDAVILVKRASTGILLSGEVDLSSNAWRVVCLGTGPNAATIS